jgi:hypothetical protein
LKKDYRISEGKLEGRELLVDVGADLNIILDFILLMWNEW